MLRLRYEISNKIGLKAGIGLGNKSSIDKQVRAYYINEKVMPNSISESGTKIY